MRDAMSQALLLPLVLLALVFPPIAAFLLLRRDYGLPGCLALIVTILEVLLILGTISAFSNCFYPLGGEPDTCKEQDRNLLRLAVITAAMAAAAVIAFFVEWALRSSRVQSSGITTFGDSQPISNPSLATNGPVETVVQRTPSSDLIGLQWDGHRLLVRNESETPVTNAAADVRLDRTRFVSVSPRLNPVLPGAEVWLDETSTYTRPNAPASMPSPTANTVLVKLRWGQGGAAKESPWTRLEVQIWPALH